MGSKGRPNISPVQGVRSNRYSGSKMSNWTDFYPTDSAIDKIYNKFYDTISDQKRKGIFFHQEVTHKDFIMPLNIDDIKREIDKLPKRFIDGIKAILLLAGSKKQLKVFDSKLFTYGTYWNDMIFIHPFPKSNMNLYYRNALKPNIKNDYLRVGAVVEKDDKIGMWIKWNNENLKAFYLRDVLIHEIGHHYDKKDKRTEGFAEWFATVYGFKFRHFNKTI